MNKIVINASYGGFGITDAAYDLYVSKGGKIANYELSYESNRWDPLLIEVVEELGHKASGTYSDLRIVTIPGVEYNIDEYDGQESIIYPEQKTRWLIVDTPEARDRFPEKFL